jgi:hypothetical protein
VLAYRLHRPLLLQLAMRRGGDQSGRGRLSANGGCNAHAACVDVDEGLAAHGGGARFGVRLPRDRAS